MDGAYAGSARAWLCRKHAATSARLGVVASGAAGVSNARIGIADADSGSYYALFKIASRFGLDSDSIKTISLKSPAGELAALSRGEVDRSTLAICNRASLEGARAAAALSNFAQWQQQGVVFTTANNITTRRNLIDRFTRAYQRGTADYQLNFLSYDDAGDFIPGPNYDRYLDLIARSANFFQCAGHNENLLRSAREPRLSDIEKQVLFWQSQGRLDKRIVAADLLVVSFISEEAITPQSWRR